MIAEGEVHWTIKSLETQTAALFLSLGLHFVRLHPMGDATGITLARGVDDHDHATFEHTSICFVLPLPRGRETDAITLANLILRDRTKMSGKVRRRGGQSARQRSSIHKLSATK